MLYTSGEMIRMALLLALSVFHFLLFYLWAPSSVSVSPSTERYVWDALLSPWTLAVFVAITAIIGVFISIKTKAHLYRCIETRSVCLLFAFSALSSLCFNVYSFDVPEQLPMSLVLVAGCICIGLGLFGRWSALCWFPVIFLSLIASAAHYMNMEISYGNLIELFGATWEDSKDYVTPLNVALLISAVLISGVWLIPAFIIMRRTPRVSLMFCGFLLVTLALSLLQFSDKSIPKDKRSLWPVGSCTSTCYHVCRALKIIRGMKQILQYLPPKGSAILDEPLPLAEDEGIICVLHIGESMRADHLSINGYHRDTTPRMAAMTDLISFSDCTASAPMTDRATMVMLTNARRDYLSAHNRADFATSPALPDFFAASERFQTSSFWAKGALHGQVAPLWVEEVKFYTRSIADNAEIPGLPLDQLPYIKEYICRHEGKNLFILLNNRGSHSPFIEYDAGKAHFPVSQTISYSLSPGNNEKDAQDVLNAYDNTAYELDVYISELIEHMRGKPFLYIYMSDHGEYVGEEGYWYRAYTSENLFFRTSACKVPFIVYASPELLDKKPDFKEKIDRLKNRKDFMVGQEHLFHTILGLFGFKTPFYTEELDLSSEKVLPYAGPHPSRQGKEATF